MAGISHAGPAASKRFKRTHVPTKIVNFLETAQNLFFT